jgi:hypothetical protein
VTTFAPSGPLRAIPTAPAVEDLNDLKRPTRRRGD